MIAVTAVTAVARVTSVLWGSTVVVAHRRVVMLRCRHAAVILMRSVFVVLVMLAHRKLLARMHPDQPGANG
ncbi:hypothetical protein ASD43_11360 [Microbacterium sp. Root553]|nr:hypothetical protein ASD43_11360 [Microbacterium sp. Root553]KRD52178.1 hypothetical protein ASE34_09860 [Microbacterium sp. Root280D1]